VKHLTSKMGRKVIPLLVAFALGALAHDLLAGQRMWAYHKEVAAVQVAEAEKAFGEQALVAIKQVNRGAIAAAKRGAGLLMDEQRAAEQANLRRAQEVRDASLMRVAASGLPKR
jgi:hypothetical protein